MANRYDVIVVGARCAGSPTAMLLARQGYKVLVVDRATFPSDTVSTHLLHPPGVAAQLSRSGRWARLAPVGVRTALLLALHEWCGRRLGRTADRQRRPDQLNSW